MVITFSTYLIVEKEIGVLKFSKIYCLRYVFYFLSIFHLFFILYTFIWDTHATSKILENFCGVFLYCVLIFQGFNGEKYWQKLKKKISQINVCCPCYYKVKYVQGQQTLISHLSLWCQTFKRRQKPTIMLKVKVFFVLVNCLTNYKFSISWAIELQGNIL